MWERRIRLLAGLLVTAYVIPHLINHALGLVSLEAAEAMHADRMHRLRESRDAWKAAAADLDSAENLRERRVHEEAGRARAASERALDELQVTRQRRPR